MADTIRERLSSLFSSGDRVGTEDPVSRRIVHLPWSYVHSDGLIEMQREEPPWLYWVMPTSPAAWTDEDDRLHSGYRLHELLTELGSTSPIPMGGRPALANNREIHIVTITLDTPPEVPGDASPAHGELLRDVFDSLGGYLVPSRVCFIGIKMFPPGLMKQINNGTISLQTDSLKAITRTLLGIASSTRDLYRDDIDLIKAILSKHRCHPPQQSELATLLSWYNRGMGNGVRMHSHPSYIEVMDRDDRIEFASIRSFDEAIQHGTTYNWASEAISHYSGAIVVSLRAELEPPEVTINRIRAVSRKQRSSLQEMGSTNDLSDDTQIDKYSLQRQVESYLRTTNEPTLMHTSIVLARYAHEVQETYIDMLRQRFRINAKPLWHRQMSGLQECLPGPSVRLSRTEQPMNINGVAFAGINALGELGDQKGIYVGRSDPDLSLCWVDPTAARYGSSRDQSPGVAILGDSGSGKRLSLTTVIPTPSGQTTMGDIQIGDQVFGRDGKPCTVRYVSPIETNPDLFQITLSDGQIIQADREHQWIVSSAKDRSISRQQQTAMAHWTTKQTEIDSIKALAQAKDDTMSTSAELLDLLHTHHLASTWRDTRYIEEILSFTDCPYLESGLDTARLYPLGVALKSVAMRLSQQTGSPPKAGLVERVLTTGDMLYEGLYAEGPTSHGYNFSIRTTEPLSLRDRVLPIDPQTLGEKLGITGAAGDGTAPSEYERIPPEFLRASAEQRLALLRGLVTTAGSTVTSDTSITVSDELLARDIVSLVRSLGMVASAATLNEGEEAAPVGGQRWTVRFRAVLPGSGGEHRGDTTWVGENLLYVVDIRPIAASPARCIQVDSLDGSYLCGDYIPTHNTFFMQWMALQSAWMGRTVFYINPKPQDDLSPLVRLASRQCKAEVINLGDAVNDPGAFDPFRFAPPAFIHEIAAQYLIDVLGREWGDRVQTRLMNTLRQAVMSGEVHCMYDAIQWIDDEDTKGTIMELADSNSMFALAIARTPRPRMDINGGLTLIQFDQVLPDAEDEHDLSVPDRVLLAIMRLIPRVSLEVLLRADGGDIYVDEAHRLLSSRAGRSFIERQGREGRSQGIMSVLGTHKPSEIVSAGVSEFMGRIFALKLKNADEAAIALDLIGMDPTDRSRIDLMRSAIAPMAPDHASHTPAKPAQAFHRDINQRKGLISIYPIPEWVRIELSTSTEDRMIRQSVDPQSASTIDPQILNV